MTVLLQTFVLGQGYKRKTNNMSSFCFDLFVSHGILCEHSEVVFVVGGT